MIVTYKPLSREEALRRWNAAKQKKREMMERAQQEAIEEYEARTGLKANYVEVW